MPATQPWKRFERECARDVGTERIPANGERDGADFETDLFVFSAKRRKGSFPRTVADWLDRVRTKASTVHAESSDATGRRTKLDEAKLGILVIHRPRASRSEALVVMTWGDFVDLLGGPRIRRLW